MSATYRIIDEPAPSTLERVIVNPVWPLFASMFAGAWLAFPWFVLNSFALGGRRRFVDLAIAVGGLVLSGAVLLGIDLLQLDMTLTERSVPYALLIPVGLRLGVVYWLFLRQEQTFELFTHFGGEPRNAMIVVAAGFMLRDRVVAALPEFWLKLLT